MKKSFFLILISVFLFFNPVMAQWEAGPVGGIILSDIIIENIKVSTDYSINPSFGIMGTFLPDRKKPGVKLLLSQLNMGFVEKNYNGDISYTNSGFNFQFLSYLYIPAKSFRISIEAGPGLTYLHLPTVSPSQDQSVLPKFEEGNISKLMADIIGGIGFAQPIGKLSVSVHSVFTFSTTKIFRNYLGYSNSLTLQAWMGVQYRFINQKNTN